MERTNINLVLLSPSPEVNKLTFSSIPTTTTVAELRERISAVVVSHPAPARQRLIYRGHALIDGRKTLKDIFTQEIIDSSETLSLHLVLPPETAAQSGASSTHSTIPDRSRPSSILQQTHESPSPLTPRSRPEDSGSTSSAQGMPSHGNVAPPRAPVESHQAQHGQVHGTLPNGQLPPQLQQAFAQFQAVNQQLAAQLAAIGTNPGFQAMAHHQAQAQPLPPPNIIHPMFQNNQFQQQHARAAVGQAGLAVPQPLVQGNPPAAAPTQHEIAPGPVQSSTPGSTNTVVRENRGSSGERWQMVIQSGQININPNHNLHNHANSLPGQSRRASPAPQNIHSAPLTVPSIGLMQLQSNISAMETAMAGGNPLPEIVFEQARQMLNGIPNLPQELLSTLHTRLNDAAHLAHHLRENLNSHLSRAIHDRVTAQRATQGVDSSAVYILSSPSGPQALLISPTGQYLAPWQTPGLGHMPQGFVRHHSPGAPMPNQTLNRNSSTNGQSSNNDITQIAPAQQAAPQQAVAAGAAQVQQQQQVNQARELLRVLLPLGGHLWLLIRLFGFVYFFTAGAGWRRTILLGLVACLLFVAQTGVFRPVIQAIWDPLRRHAEGLVPLAGNERPRAATPGAGDHANATVEQLVDREPTPQEAAERLLQEREGRGVSLLRQSMRRIERAIALFVASLVPGVGERHIAAREAAEAARQAEFREREDRTRREEEEMQRRDGITADIGGGNAAVAGDSAQNAPTPAQEQASQPPLMEV